MVGGGGRHRPLDDLFGFGSIDRGGAGEGGNGEKESGHGKLLKRMITRRTLICSGFIAGRGGISPRGLPLRVSPFPRPSNRRGKKPVRQPIDGRRWGIAQPAPWRQPPTALCS